MPRKVIILMLLAVPILVGAATREPAHSVGNPAQPPESDRGDAWIQYDQDAWPWYWANGAYFGNIFCPRDAGWYPFTVEQVQYRYARIDGQGTAGAAGIINRMRVFDSALATVAEWVDVAGNVNVWQTVTAAMPPAVSGPFYVAGWDEATPGDVLLQGTVDAALWPGPYWPVANIEPLIVITGPTTSAATTGWSASTGGGTGYPTTSVVSLRVLVSGETVPVELCALEGRARPGYVVISWTTASELDNIGFNVYRSETESGQYAKINDEIIAGHGTTATEHAYTFADHGVQPGRTYYYKVEDVGADGTTMLHGPIAVPLGGEFISSWGEIKAQFK